MRLHRLKLLSALCCSSFPLGLAAAAPQLTEEVFFDDIPPVVSASRQQLSLSESPSSVTIITRDMIAAMPVLDIADLLRIAPGFQSFKANGSIHAVTLHGQSDRFPRRLEIRVDGRTVYTPINSAVSWESLGLVPDDIDRIEVVRGSNIPAYGGNASQGAIYIITRNPQLDTGTQVRATAGSWYTRNLSARHNFDTERGNYVVRTAWKENDGFRAVNDQAHVGHIALQGLHTPSLDSSLSWETGLSRGSFGFGDGDRPASFHDEDITSLWSTGRWNRAFKRHAVSLHGSLSMAEYDRSNWVWLSEYDSDFLRLDLPAQGIPDQKVQAQAGVRRFQQLDLEFEHQISVGRNSDFLWGTGIRHVRLRADQQFAEPGYHHDTIYHVFANHQWRPARWLGINLGAMAEHHDQTSWNLSPRLSFNFHLNEDHHLRLSTSQARRSPTLYEMQFLNETRLANGELFRMIFVTDPDIRSEKFTTHEIGYLGRWHDGRLSLDVRGFREEVDHGIDFKRRVTGFEERIVQRAYRQLTNPSQWTIEGYDLQLRWKPDRDWLIALQHANVSVEGLLVSENNHLTRLDWRTPNHTSSALVQKHFGNQWSASMAAYRQSATAWRAGTYVEQWLRVDGRVARRFDLHDGSEIEVALIVQNLFDEDYLEYQNSNEFPRLGFLSVNWRRH